MSIYLGFKSECFNIVVSILCVCISHICGAADRQNISMFWVCEVFKVICCDVAIMVKQLAF